MSEIPKQYDPKEAQAKWFPYWESRGHFNADPQPPVSEGGKESHTIMIPLPNVTGALHMGHALNGTCQDLITRWKRMQGFEALWMPGTDHAGIATQAVVERRMLEEEGLTRHDVGRDALVERIWTWKDAYEKRIVGQLKSIGSSCDWRRIRFTLDDVCARAVRHTFFKMFKDGLIYRGKRLVNWDTFLQTAVADDEVFEEEIEGHFWTFHYKVVDEAGNDTNEVIRFSTTRPETMLGDTAVCVHPTDERYTHLVGKKVRIPLNGRLIPIVADDQLADKELGTGAVKVTPAHDPNDYACWQRKLGRRDEIGIINILNPDGTLNHMSATGATDWHWESTASIVAQSYVGLDRHIVRNMVVADMEAMGQFENVEDRKIPLKHSDRSKTPVEPYLSDQWFVKMDDHVDGRPGLAQMAIDAVNGSRVRFYPSRYAKTYLDWLGEKRDWCISRQLWWGHRIPIWSRRIDLSSIPKEGRVHAVDTAVHAAGKAVVAGLGRPHELVMRVGGEDFSQERGIVSNSKTVFAAGAFEIQGGEIPGVAFRCIADAGFVTESIEESASATVLVCIKEGHREIERQLESNGFTQDPDVLDTWFSSALWPHATLGWPDLDHDPPLNAEECAKQTALSPGDSPGAKGSSTNTVLNTFYPGSVLITSRDIITLWVARMVLTGLYNMGDVPFRHVHVHPKILDGFGQTMSKSKGNGVDPVDLIEKYGADAVRFTIASFAGETQDVRLPISYECPKCETLIPQSLKHQKAKLEDGKKPTVRCPKCKADYQFTSPAYDPDPGVPVARMVSERFEYGRNFCNKFWNAARFAMLNLEGYTPGEVTADQLQLEDRWILSRLSTVTQQVDQYLSRYQFDAATRAIREFTWNEFCDWYLEMIKPRLRSTLAPGESPGGAGDETRAVAQRVLLAVLDSLVRLLQPFTPFICEELWQRLKEIAPTRALPVQESGVRGQGSATQSPPASRLKPQASEEAAIIAAWPRIPTAWQDEALERRFARLQETIIAVRNVRAIYSIPPGTPVKLLMRASADVAGDIQSVASQFDNLAKAVLEAAGAEVQRPSGSATFSLGETEGFIPLEGLIDREAELDRQTKEADKLRKHIAGHEGKLSNESFTAKAPPEVVAQVRETLDGLKRQLESVEAVIRDLG